jgi:hypothetical protein
MSVSTLYRATANLNRTTANFTRKHSRASLIAGSAAAVGVLGAAGFSVGAAPWAQAIDNVAKTAQSDLPSASSRPVTNLFAPITDAKPANGKPLASGPLDTIRSAATAGGTNGTAAIGHAAVGQAAAKEQGTAGAAQYVPKHAVKQPAAKPQAAKPAAKAPAAPHVAKHRAAKPKAHAAPAEPYTIYDSVKPGAIPNGKAAAVYVNGAYAASAAQVAGYGSVLWIDTNGSDPAANVLDVEPGDATPAGAAQWAKQRLSSQPHSVAIIYTMMNDWQQVKDNMATLPGWMHTKVRYWIADPTGVPHVVPGASATQWYWGNSYDVTTANPDFVN